MGDISRRNFLIKSTVTVGGLIGTSLTAGSMIAPKKALAQKIEFSQKSCRTNSRKILVAYSSLCGSTGEIAMAIGDVLCRHGADVDVQFIDNITDISPYDGAVIGSAVKSSSWHSEAIDFVKRHQVKLSTIPVVYFLTCLALTVENNRTYETAMGYFRPVLNKVPEVKPIEMKPFAGVLDYSKLSFMYKTVMKSKMKKRGIKQGDYRDFNKISDWAKTTAATVFV